MFGTPEPGAWFGLVEARRYLIEGIGLVYMASDGRWWIGLKRCPTISKTRTLLTGARQVLAMAHERGLVVHAIPDPTIPGSSRLLEGLGFTRTDETQGGFNVWTR
jgi:hypothetical protein